MYKDDNLGLFLSLRHILFFLIEIITQNNRHMENADKSAFPPLPSYTDEERGLTKREYFAGLAMQGILASSKDAGIQYVLKLAISCADELLEQLEQTPNLPSRHESKME